MEKKQNKNMRALCSKFYVTKENTYMRPNPNSFCQQEWSGEWAEGISYLMNIKFLIYVMEGSRNWYKTK